MKKRNLILVLALVTAALLLLFFGLSGRGEKILPEESDGKETDIAAETSAFSESVTAKAREYMDKNPAQSYLMVITDTYNSTPLPLNEEGSFRITQPDGSENVVHIGKDSFYMESSNCDNQNCVEEGEVTLENKDSRILFNMVYCLPHKLSLALLTPEEAEEALCETYAQKELYEAYMESLKPAESAEETE